MTRDDSIAAPPKRSNRLGSLLLMLGVLSLSRPAWAEPEVATLYREVISDALAEFEARNYLEAHALFLRAHKLQPNARTLRGLGAVSFELRRYAESSAYLEAALASNEKPLSGELRVESERLRQRASAFVGELKLQLEPSAARVLVDGQPVSFDPARGSLWLDLGEHRLEFQLEGYVPEQRSYRAQGGESTSWAVTLNPAGARDEPTTSGAHRESAKEQVVILAAPEPPAERMPSRGKRRNRILYGSAFAAAGGVTVGLAAFRFRAHVENGLLVRMRAPEEIRFQHRWTESRTLPLVLAGVGSGVLAASAATFAPLVPRAHRRWLAPVLVAAGVGALAAGLVGVARGASCGTDAANEVRRCVLDSERRDRGWIVSFVSVPLLTIPAMHGFEWLRGP